MDSEEQKTLIEVDRDSASIIQLLKERAAAQGISLDTILRRLASEVPNGATEKPFYETATREEWLKAFNEWVDGHDPNTPVILDDSREAIYGDDGR
ncbi:MAG TPA: hypothetical protein VF131_15215 [Blastocatellia bacterium]|nr:hypothetical protein [Blastocatellia bacterium]